MSRRANGQGCISLRKDGRWQVRVQLHSVRRCLYADSQREAQRKLVDLQRQAASGCFVKPSAKTLNDLLDRWFSSAERSRKATTMAWYRGIAAKKIRPELGRIKLSKLSPSDLERLYADLSGRTAQVVDRMLRRACKLGVLWHLMSSNPTDAVVPPAYRARRKPVPTPGQLRQFLDATIAHWLSPLWIALALSGCRIGELLALKWNDVDLASGRIRLGSNLQRLQGHWVELTPKSTASARTILLPAEGVTALRHQRAQQAEWRLKAANWEDGDYVFTGKGGNPIHRATVGHAMATECKRLNLPTMNPHRFRHMFASLLLSQGLPVTAVSARLGHSRPSVTMSVYAHEIGNGEREAALAIERALGLPGRDHSSAAKNGRAVDSNRDWQVTPTPDQKATGGKR